MAAVQGRAADRDSPAAAASGPGEAAGPPPEAGLPRGFGLGEGFRQGQPPAVDEAALRLSGAAPLPLQPHARALTAREAAPA